MSATELWQLLHAGDWACAHADAENLGRICDRISRMVSGRPAKLARQVYVLADHDLRAASSLWGTLAELLRSEGESHPAPL